MESLKPGQRIVRAAAAMLFVVFVLNLAAKLFVAEWRALAVLAAIVLVSIATIQFTRRRGGW